MPRQDLAQAITGLQARTVRARQRAAKSLRRIKDRSAGPALLEALRRELQDPDAWETAWEAQYQMIMALAESGYELALPELRELARREFEATALYAAIGDAIVRLGRRSENDPEPLLEIMASSSRMLIDGAFRGVAMLRLALDPETVETVIVHVSNLDLDDGLRFWVAAAAADWSGTIVERFLAECATSPREDIRTAALSSQRKKYRRWHPL